MVDSNMRHEDSLQKARKFYVINKCTVLLAAGLISIFYMSFILTGEMKPKIRVGNTTDTPNQPMIERVSNVTSCKPLFPQLSARKLPLTGLVSYPGSGNTWTRYLLHKVSGVGTADVGCNKKSIRPDFPFNCNHSQYIYSHVLAVKTHHQFVPISERTSHSELTVLRYERLILLIRNPFRCLLAYFNWRFGGGMREHAKNILFFDGTWEKWQQREIERWEKLYTSWLENFKGPIYVIFYEMLLNDTQGELRRIFKFLRYPLKEDNLRCALMNSEGDAHRQKQPVMTEQNDTVQFENLFPKMAAVIESAGRKVTRIIQQQLGQTLEYTLKNT